MSADSTPGSDTVVLTLPGPNRKPHPVHQWRRRAPAAWQGANVRACWREAERVTAVGATAVRYHEPSGMTLIAEHGVLQTAVHTGHRPTAGQFIGGEL